MRRKAEPVSMNAALYILRQRRTAGPNRASGADGDGPSALRPTNSDKAAMIAKANFPKPDTDAPSGAAREHRSRGAGAVLASVMCSRPADFPHGFVRPRLM